jgi:hypothetical protein
MIYVQENVLIDCVIQNWSMVVVVMPAGRPLQFPQVILDGILEILSFPCDTNSPHFVLYVKLADTFFPSVQGDAAKILDTQSGDLEPLMTEDQALRLARVEYKYLLDAALSQFTGSQLLQHVHTYGLNMVSASAGLQRLDSIVQPFLNSPINQQSPFPLPLPFKASEIRQHLHSLWKRGAKGMQTTSYHMAIPDSFPSGGNLFLQFINRLDPARHHPPRKPVHFSHPGKQAIRTQKTHAKQETTVKSTLFTLFTHPYTIATDQQFQQWKETLMSDIAATTPSNLAHLMVDALLEFLKGNPTCSLALKKSSQYSITLIQLLFSFYAKHGPSPKFAEVIQKIEVDDSVLGVSVQKYKDFMTPSPNGKPKVDVENMEIKAQHGTMGEAFQVLQILAEVKAESKTCRQALEHLKNCEKVQTDVPAQAITELLVILGKESPDLFEEFMDHFFQKFLQNAETSASVAILGEGLILSIPIISQLSGLLSDLADILLPEMQSSKVMELIFSRKNPDLAQKLKPFVTHLMSVLLHDSSWSSMEIMVQWIFHRDREFQVSNFIHVKCMALIVCIGFRFIQHFNLPHSLPATPSYCSYKPKSYTSSLYSKIHLHALRLSYF